MELDWIKCGAHYKDNEIVDDGFFFSMQSICDLIEYYLVFFSNTLTTLLVESFLLRLRTDRERETHIHTMGLRKILSFSASR